MNAGKKLGTVARMCITLTTRPNPVSSTLKCNGDRILPYIPKVCADSCLKQSTQSLSFTPSFISLLNSPTSKIQKEIGDPLKYLRVEINTPPETKRKDDVSLPNSGNKEYVEPINPNAIEKRAARLVVIRKKKMKKHKWKKLQKKMKFIFARRRQKRELAKEKAYQAKLLSMVKEAEKFDAEDYVASKLKIASWERPITHVRRFRAPDWVIREHLQNEEAKKKIADRIEECLQFKKKMG